MYSVHSDILGGYNWDYGVVGAIILIFSIHFSPTLQHILSHPFAVFLGSISFPMYLLHSILMRSVLVWVVYGLIPLPPEGQARQTVLVIAFGLWLVLLIYLSVVWRDRLDGASVVFTKWAEEVMLGKKACPGSFMAIHTKLVNVFAKSRGNSHGDRDVRESKGADDLEMEGQT